MWCPRRGRKRGTPLGQPASLSQSCPDQRPFLARHLDHCVTRFDCARCGRTRRRGRSLIVFWIPVAVGIIAGKLLGGRISNLAALRLKHSWIFVFVAAVQVALIFAPPVLPGSGLDPLRVCLPLTTAGVGAFVLLNRGLPGMRLVLMGLCANLTVILANGGLMPVTLDALVRAGMTDSAELGRQFPGIRQPRSKDVILAPAQTQLYWLSDVIVSPPLPKPKTMSVGDLAIAAGLAYLTARGMRSPLSHMGGTADPKHHSSSKEHHHGAADTFPLELDRMPVQALAADSGRTAPWPEPPRLFPPHGRRPAQPPRRGAAPTDIFPSAVAHPPSPSGAAGLGPAAGPTASANVTLSPGLAQLLNAALIESAFCAAFLDSPVDAVRRALAEPGDTFGTALPDPTLQLPPLAVSAADLHLLRDLPRAGTLPGAARALRRIHSEAQAQEARPVGRTALASHEGALAGALSADSSHFAELVEPVELDAVTDLAGAA